MKKKMAFNMNGFVESVDAWRDFYMLTGSASATLTGLIFVAVSLHIDVIAEAKRSSDIRMLAGQIFINFVLILSFAFIFMIPSDTPYGIGVPLLILGVIELVHTIGLWRSFLKGRKERDNMFAPSQILWKLLIPGTVCYSALVIIAYDILQGNVRLLGWMVLVIVWLIVSATENTWDLMLRIAEMKKHDSKA